MDSSSVARFAAYLGPMARSLGIPGGRAGLHSHVVCVCRYHVDTEPHADEVAEGLCLLIDGFEPALCGRGVGRPLRLAVNGTRGTNRDWRDDHGEDAPACLLLNLAAFCIPMVRRDVHEDALVNIAGFALSSPGATVLQPLSCVTADLLAALWPSNQALFAHLSACVANGIAPTVLPIIRDATRRTGPQPSRHRSGMEMPARSRDFWWLHDEVPWGFPGTEEALAFVQSEWGRVQAWLAEGRAACSGVRSQFSCPPRRVSPLSLLPEMPDAQLSPLDRNCAVAALEALGPNEPDERRWSALHQAAQWGMEEDIRRLVGDGFPVNSLDEDCKTPLHQAAMWGRAGAVDALLGLGAAASADDECGLRPLHDASIEGHSEVLAPLAAEGGEPDVRDAHGRTPLHAAAWDLGEQTSDVIGTLLSLGCCINAQDKDGLTPLHHAVRSGSHVAELAEAGADLSVRSRSSLTPLGLARLLGRRWAAVVLQERGAVE